MNFNVADSSDIRQLLDGSFDRGSKDHNFLRQYLVGGSRSETIYQKVKDQPYWMAYMDMDPRFRKALAVGIFLLNYIVVCANVNIGAIINLLGSTTIPLMINVFPGYLYYRYCSDNRDAN